MKRMIHGALMILAVVLISSNTQAQSDLIGDCKLNTYGYDNNGSMRFSLVEGISYEFKEDNTGVLLNYGQSANFTWKKKNLTLTFSGKDVNYRIVELSSSDLIIVDKNLGKQGDRSYVAYEKGLIFEKKQ
ncbi:MAG: hypothetical protein ACJA0U_002462 [Salibacteraceae bacterium]|jgi:hypothetical protein